MLGEVCAQLLGLAELRQSIDHTLEVSAAELAAADILYTDSVEELRLADFHIVAVPTPVDEALRGSTLTVERPISAGRATVFRYALTRDGATTRGVAFACFAARGDRIERLRLFRA